MKSVFRSILATACFATLMGSAANAAIVLALEGTPGSSDFTLTASGSFTSSGPATSNSNGDWLRIIRTDLGSIGWYAPTGSQWTGSIFSTAPTSGIETGSSGSLIFEVTGDVSSTHTFNDVTRTSSVWLPYDQSNTLDWPTVQSNQTITILASGSISFTSSSITFDDLVPGTYNSTLAMNDGLQYTVSQSGATVVPLPSGAWLLLGALGAVGVLRRRKS